MEATEYNNTVIDKVLAKLDQINQSIRNPEKQLSETWLDVNQTMKVLNLSRRTLQIYRDTGVLPFSQIGNKIYFRATDIEEHLNRHYVKAFNQKR